MKKSPVKPSLITLGKFDGVHKGHTVLIETAIAFAHDLDFRKKFLEEQQFEITQENFEDMQKDMDVRIVTFEPHPHLMFQTKNFSPLMDENARIRNLQDFNVEYVEIMHFDKEFAEQSAEDFCIKLLESFNMKCLFIGYDFTMGSDKCDKNALLKLAKKYDFYVFSLAPVLLEKPKLTKTPITISSSQIRKAVAEGNISLANAMLNKAFTIRGEVVHGAKRGGDLLGFPTANMKAQTVLVPKRGVYATKCRFLPKNNANPSNPQSAFSDKVFNAVTNIGFNPTFGENEQSIETFIFDFSGNIYGEKIELEFHHFIRDERKFQSIDDLREQIDKDCALAKEFL